MQLHSASPRNTTDLANGILYLLKTAQASGHEYLRTDLSLQLQVPFNIGIGKFLESTYRNRSKPLQNHCIHPVQNQCPPNLPSADIQRRMTPASTRTGPSIEQVTTSDVGTVHCVYRTRRSAICLPGGGACRSSKRLQLLDFSRASRHCPRLTG